MKLPESKTTDFGGFIDGGIWYKEGGSIYNSFRAEYAGVNEQGEALYYVDSELGEGVTNRPGTNRDATTTNLNNATKYEQGSLLPKVYGGFGTSLSLYGVDVSLTFDYQLGGKIYDSLYAGLMSNIADAGGAGSAIHVDALKAWTETNPIYGRNFQPLVDKCQLSELPVIYRRLYFAEEMVVRLRYRKTACLCFGRKPLLLVCS